LGMRHGYSFVLYHGWLQSVTVGVLLLAMARIVSRRKITLDAREQVVLNLLFPMMIFFQIYLIYSHRQSRTLHLILCLLFSFLAMVSMMRLFFHYRFCIPLKIVCGVISIIPMVILFFVTCLGALVSAFGIVEHFCGEFGKTSVVKQVASPDQSYVAEVVDVDEGALGGETLVNIKGTGKEIPVLLGKLVPDEENVYEGNWGEFENMVIKWKDNETLLIDGKEYTVDGDE
ncbi:MAG: DUF5412 domain-containing protein, partial [Lachnospiraceae bacterium]|nr:DUF5412 domain-containing protein [Lachnospiraceae bacterium]